MTEAVLIAYIVCLGIAPFFGLILLGMRRERLEKEKLLRRAILVVARKHIRNTNSWRQ